MSWQSMEAEATFMPFDKPYYKTDPSTDIKDMDSINTKLEELPDKVGGTNLKVIGLRSGGYLEVPTAKRGNRTGGGMNALNGFGKLEQEMAGYPSGTSSQFRIENVEKNYENDRIVHYIYDKYAMPDPVCTKPNPAVLNPLSSELLQTGIWESNQEGFKKTKSGAHGHQFLNEVPKFVDKNKAGTEVDKELVDEAARSKFGNRVMYEHNSFGEPFKLTGGQQSNMAGKASDTVPQNKITRAMKGKRGDNPSGRYAGLKAI